MQDLPGSFLSRRGGEQCGHLSGARGCPTQRGNDYRVHAVRHRGDAGADSAAGRPPRACQRRQPADIHPAGDWLFKYCICTLGPQHFL